MKTLFYVILCSVLLFPTAALAVEMPDQVCVGNPFEEGKAISIQYSLNGQVFIPTMNHIKKAAIFAKAVNSPSAKVKLKIQKAWWSSDRPSYEKIIVLNSDAWWYEADFSEVPVEPGVAYFLTAEPLNNAMIQWYIRENPDCNPNGYAFESGNIERGKDFYFSIRSENETTQLEEPTEVREDGGQVSGATPIASVTHPSTTNTITSTIVSSSSKLNQSPKSNSSDKVSRGISQSEAVGSNKSTSNSNRLGDEEMDQILAMIEEDYKANHKTGAFGLSGVVGRILSWPVFYTSISLAVVIILTIIILRSRRKRNQ